MKELRSTLLPPPDDYNFVHSASVICGDTEADLSCKVPLSPAQEERAMGVYRRSRVILAHSHSVEPWDFQEMRESGIHAVILKVDVDGINVLKGAVRTDVPAAEDWFPRGNRAMQRILELAAQPENGILIVRSAGDFDRAQREGKVGIVLSFEGARPLCGQLKNVKHFHDLGMRELQLWWAVPNETKTPDQQQLNAFGLDLIRELNRIGIVIDLSHMTGKAFGQAMATTRLPVIISHCSVNELYEKSAPGDRTLSGTDLLNDASIRAMAANGGLICVHFVTPDYIKARHGSKATVEDLVDHIDYIRGLAGIDSVGLGPDYLPEPGWRWVESAGQMRLLPNVVREMVRRNFTDEEIEKVLGKNLVRVLAANWEQGPRQA
jgi:membrane dipeptidase